MEHTTGVAILVLRRVVTQRSTFKELDDFTLAPRPEALNADFTVDIDIDCCKRLPIIPYSVISTDEVIERIDYAIRFVDVFLEENIFACVGKVPLFLRYLQRRKLTPVAGGGGKITKWIFSECATIASALTCDDIIHTTCAVCDGFRWGRYQYKAYCF